MLILYVSDASLHIGEVAQHINEHIKQQDNFNKMLAIQKSLAGPVAPKILTPGRIFIKDGPLKKVIINIVYVMHYRASNYNTRSDFKKIKINKKTL